jgi:type VI secretion system protein ImpC
MVERIVAPDLVPRESTDSLQATADRELRASVLARAILHHPRFQALESIWRWLDFLVRRLETGERLKLYIADISKEELTACLLKTDNFRSSAVYKIVIQDAIQSGERQPWAVIAGNYAFDRSNAGDIELLARMGLLARAAGAPLLAECLPSQSKSVESDAWSALRKSSHATWIGLALPRILLRLPYGKDTCTVESFAFEEMPGEPKHEEYLWGNPGLGCAYLLAKAFCESGGRLAPGTNQQIDDLPFHTFKLGGETRAQPPAEVLLIDNDCELLGQQGLMAFRAFKDRDSLRLAGFRSIAEPPTALSGRWK